ncbi:MAG: hypothetical protein Q4C95_01190 [Planctomycetia bacterium]|nr:hypothetical protein [Planctomycetia bacterium]
MRNKIEKNLSSDSNQENNLTKRYFAGFQPILFGLVIGFIFLGNGLVQNIFATDHSSETSWTTPTGEKIKQIGIDDSEETEPLPLNAFKNKTTEFTISTSEIEKPPILLVQGTQNLSKSSQAEIPQFLPVSPVSPVPTELPNQNLTSSANQKSVATLQETSNQLEEQTLPSGVIAPEDVLSETDLQKEFDDSIVLPDGSTVPLKTNNPLIFDPLQTQSALPNPSNQKSNKGIAAPFQQSNQLPTIPNIQTQQQPPLTSNNVRHSGTFSNIGNLGTRLEDGSMVGNPYALPGSQDYQPSFLYGGQQNEIPTGMPPVEVYGQDMNGNPSYYCQSQLFQKLRWTLQNTTFDFGVLGFRNPLDLNNTGNFGVDIAVNWSTPQRFLMGLTAQGGGRLTQTALNGYSETNGFDYDDARTQLFWTSGLFYRNPMSPWQFGAVYDSLNDTYYRKYTLGQARLEISRRFNGTTDIGFRGAFRVHDELVNLWRVNSETYIKDKAQVTSYYTGFIRKYFEAGGEGMLFGGVTEWSEGLVGGQIEIPINDHMTLKNSFTYVFANDRNVNDLDEQTWNVSAGITIYLGGNSRKSMRNPLRPMFDVADNGTFLQNFQR